MTGHDAPTRAGVHAPMTVLVTGGAGFLGTRLIQALLAAPEPPARVLCIDRTASPLDDSRVESRIGSITDRAFVDTVVTEDVTTIWHLAAVLSGQSEAEFDTGLAVNLGGTTALLERCRAVGRRPRFVFSSTVAVFGGPLPEVVPETMAVWPQSSYGTAKSIGEYLINDFSRRGFIDGIAVRVPTVAIRPGKPNSAVSSFVSGIIREPVNGVDSVCPVPLGTRLWICSPDAATANIVHAARVPGIALGPWRTVNLPGISTEELHRGLVVTTPGWLPPAGAVDVRLDAVRDLAKPLRHNTTVTFHTGAAEVSGKVRLLDRDDPFDAV